MQFNHLQEHRKQIHGWRSLSSFHVRASDKIIENSNQLINLGISKFDALHIACAIEGGCDYFLTTDDKVLNKNDKIEEISQKAMELQRDIEQLSGQ